MVTRATVQPKRARKLNVAFYKMKKNLKVFGGLLNANNRKRRPALVNFSEQLKLAYQPLTFIEGERINNPMT